MTLESSLIVLIVILFEQVEAIHTCDKNVINKIRSRNGCPTNLIRTLHQMSNFTYAYSPHGTVPPTVKCAKGGLDHVTGCRADAHVYVEYKDPNTPVLEQKYSHEEVSCGLIKELDEMKNEFYIYPVFTKHCFCYYRCTPYKTEGEAFASCAVPIAKQGEKASQQCCEDCKTELVACGVNTVLDKITPCTK